MAGPNSHPVPPFAILGGANRTQERSAMAMKVTCPRCDAVINVSVTSINQGSVSWGSNDFPRIEGQCEEWGDPLNAPAKARHSCKTMDQAVSEAISPGNPASKQP